MNCSTSVTDGRRVDGGYNNTWPGFSNTPRRAHHEHVYPAAAGEGIASDPTVVTNIMTDDSGAGPWSDQDYWGDVVRLIPPETLTVSWSCLGLYIDALTALDRQPWEILFTNYHYQSARNAGNAWSYQETILTVADGAMFAVGDKVWISGTGALDGEICNVVDVTGDVVTITSETRISADTGLKYNYGGAEMMYVVRRETDRTLHGYDGTHMAASAKSFSRYVWHEAKSIEPDGAMIMRVANATDAADSSFAVRAIYVD